LDEFGEWKDAGFSANPPHSQLANMPTVITAQFFERLNGINKLSLGNPEENGCKLNVESCKLVNQFRVLSAEFRVTRRPTPSPRFSQTSHRKCRKNEKSHRRLSAAGSRDTPRPSQNRARPGHPLAGSYNTPPRFSHRSQRKCRKSEKSHRGAGSKGVAGKIGRKGVMGRHGEAECMRDTTPSMSRGKFRRMGKGASVMLSTCECDEAFLIFDI
jgi:hypothetical protein